MKHLRQPAMTCKPPLLTLLHVLGVVVIVGVAAGPLAAAMAQTPDVRITELRCSEDPEVVAITNQGNAGQDLTGWTLRSDPVETEQFDLTAIGVLAPGATVFVQSGPSASGSFIWPQNFVFRDGASNDFARIVNSAGAVVHEVNCAGGSPAPTARPSATASPSPTPSAGAIIDGGGAPPSGGITPTLAMAAGALLLVMGSGSLLALRPRQTAESATVLTVQRRKIAGGPAGNRREALYLLASFGLIVLILRLIAARRR